MAGPEANHPVETYPFLFDDHHREIARRAEALARDRIGPEEDAHGRRLSDRLAGREGADAPGADPETARAADDDATRALALARRLADADLLGLTVPEAHGGVPVGRPDDLDLRAVCIARAHLGWASGLADLVLAMQGLGSYPITAFGTPAQKEEWLPPVARGERLAAFAITEPEAGSDVSTLATTARPDGDGYVLDGTKTFISNAGIAGQYVVFATLEPGNRKAGCAFVVRPEDPGFELAARLPVLGDHPLGTIRLNACRVPASRRLGEEGAGLKIALSTLGVFRTSVGAAACGMARRALDESAARASARIQFGRPIGEHQQIQAYLADSATELTAADLLVYRAAWERDVRGGRPTVPVAMAKMYATEAAQRIIDRAVQIHGGSGVLLGAPVERLYREIRALRIYEGTTEIQKLVIADAALAAALEKGAR
jgi:acyl-CoA dehydrogenase